MFPFKDRSQLHGTVISAALHGAVALVIAHEVLSGAGTPAPQRGGQGVIALRLVASAPLQAEPIASTGSPQFVPPAQSTLGARKAGLAGDSVAPGTIHGRATGAFPGVTTAHAAEMESGGAEVGETSEYEALLRAYLRSFFTYPQSARPDRLGGTVRLHIIVARNGQVLSDWVQSSSGYAVLDASALDLIHRAQPLPALPSGGNETLEVDLPLEYAPPPIVVGG